MEGFVWHVRSEVSVATHVLSACISLLPSTLRLLCTGEQLCTCSISLTSGRRNCYTDLSGTPCKLYSVLVSSIEWWSDRGPVL